MYHSRELRCIFVHIPKNAGTSVQRALVSLDSTAVTRLELPKGERIHLGAAQIRDAIGAAAFDECFRFAVVRNPWDRLVSWYSHAVQFPGNQFHRAVQESCPTFRDFVLREDFKGAGRTRKPQTQMICDASGARLVDFVARFETLTDDFAHVVDELRARAAARGRPLAVLEGFGLPAVNRSRHGTYRDHYDTETRDVVARRFASDLEAFGYEF